MKLIKLVSKCIWFRKLLEPHFADTLTNPPCTRFSVNRIPEPFAAVESPNFVYWWLMRHCYRSKEDSFINTLK